MTGCARQGAVKVHSRPAGDGFLSYRPPGLDACICSSSSWVSARKLDEARKQALFRGEAHPPEAWTTPMRWQPYWPDERVRQGTERESVGNLLRVDRIAKPSWPPRPLGSDSSGRGQCSGAAS